MASLNSAAGTRCQMPSMKPRSSDLSPQARDPKPMTRSRQDLCSAHSFLQHLSNNPRRRCCQVASAAKKQKVASSHKFPKVAKGVMSKPKAAGKHVKPLPKQPPKVVGDASLNRPAATSLAEQQTEGGEAFEKQMRRQHRSLCKLMPAYVGDITQGILCENFSGPELSRLCGMESE